MTPVCVSRLVFRNKPKCVSQLHSSGTAQSCQCHSFAATPVRHETVKLAQLRQCRSKRASGFSVLSSDAAQRRQCHFVAVLILPRWVTCGRQAGTVAVVPV